MVPSVISARRRLTRFAPIKPAEPVTRMFMLVALENISCIDLTLYIIEG